MIQEIAPHIYHNAFHERAPRPDDLVTVFTDGKAYLTGSGVFPTVEDVLAWGAEAEALIYLFEIDETAFYLLSPGPERVLEALEPHSSMVFREMEPSYLALAGATALHLSGWYRANQFCGCCGAKMERDTVERAMRCPKCNNIVYPRINPAILAAVRHGDKILLTHYANRRNTARYALIAGFTEIGETLEDTVRREVIEEVGLPIKNVRYQGSQPWGFSGNLMVGFWADLDSDDETVTLDESELDEGVWLSRDEITPEDNTPSLTHTMIQMFRRGEDPK